MLKTVILKLQNKWLEFHQELSIIKNFYQELPDRDTLKLLQILQIYFIICLYSFKLNINVFHNIS